jgi:hypothetical protein
MPAEGLAVPGHQFHGSYVLIYASDRTIKLRWWSTDEDEFTESGNRMVRSLFVSVRFDACALLATLTIHP